MLDYRKTGAKKKLNSLPFFISNDKEILTLEEQYFLLCTLPNIKWPWVDEVPQYHYEAQFSSSSRYFYSSFLLLHILFLLNYYEILFADTIAVACSSMRLSTFRRLVLV